MQYDGGKPNNLIVAETATKTLWSFPFVDGENMSVDVSKKAVFGKCPGIIAKAYDTIYFNKKNHISLIKILLNFNRNLKAILAYSKVIKGHIRKVAKLNCSK